MRQDGWKGGAEDGRGMMISCDFWYFFFGNLAKLGPIEFGTDVEDKKTTCCG